MIEVAAGVMVDAHGCVLLMQRLPGKHLAGLWEFPGGKVEPGETIVQALGRELEEELGIEVLGSTPLISLPWHYTEKSVRLHALRVTAWRGEPRAREGHPLRWIPLPELDVASMPPADAPIVAALRLPSCCIIADAAAGLVVRAVADADADTACKHRRAPLRQLRMPGADRDEVRRVALTALAAAPGLRTALLINGDIELARELGLGVHLRSRQLREVRQRPLPHGSWVGASCHDAHELELAARLGADFATVSPVRATASHPDAKPIGWDRFAELVADAQLPVYALGGMGADDLERAIVAGAQGVSGIRAFR